MQKQTVHARHTVSTCGYFCVSYMYFHESSHIKFCENDYLTIWKLALHKSLQYITVCVCCRYLKVHIQVVIGTPVAGSGWIQSSTVSIPIPIPCCCVCATQTHVYIHEHHGQLTHPQSPVAIMAHNCSHKEGAMVECRTNSTQSLALGIMYS